jgi:hypothetical protein
MTVYPASKARHWMFWQALREDNAKLIEGD